MLKGKYMENATKIYNNMFDERNLEQILELYADRLTYFINNLVNDINTAEDIMMDCFVEILSRNLKFFDQNSFKAYIYKTAKNKSLNYIKRNRNFVKTDYENITAVQDDSIYFNETKVALLKILNDFKPIYKTVLYLCIFEEMTLDEISNVMDRSTRQIRNIKYRAMKKLRKASKELLNLEVL